MKSKNIKLFISILGFSALVVTATLSFLVKGYHNSGNIMANVYFDDIPYVFSALPGDDISINIIDGGNLDIGGSIVDDTIMKVSLDSGSNEQITCQYDMYLVWDDDFFENDIVLNENYPFELSSTIYYNDDVLVPELDLGSSILNTNTNKHEVMLFENESIIASKDSSNNKDYKIEIKAYNLPYSQANLVAKSYNAKIEIRNVSCN